MSIDSSALQDSLKEFYAIYGREGGSPRLFFASGRLNLSGSHIDYNGGFVLPIAIQKGCYIFARPNNSNHMNISFTNIAKRAQLDYFNLEVYKEEKYINYQAGVVAILLEQGIKPVGLDVLYHITVPFGRGLSSSAAIEVATAFLLMVYHNEKNDSTNPIDHLKIALMCQKAENKFIGMNCGILDQFSSSCGKKKMAMLLNCRTLAYEYVNCDLGDYVLEVIDVNKPHDLVASKYNQRRKECEAALKILQEQGGDEIKNIKYLCEMTPEVFELHGASLLSEDLLKRVRHCVREQDRVKKVAKALKVGDIAEVGRMLTESHGSSRDYFEVTTSEIDIIVSIASSLAGCAGCRLNGGGFGGSCVALVLRTDVEGFNVELERRYREATGLTCTMYEVMVGGGVREENMQE